MDASSAKYIWDIVANKCIDEFDDLKPEDALDVLSLISEAKYHK